MTSGIQMGARVDPYRVYNFKLIIQGITEGHFTQCSGFGIKVESIPYREGGAGRVVRRLPGRVEYGDITLRYGLTASKQLWDWFMKTVQGKVERQNVSIVMLEEDGITEAWRWNLENAWPSEWRGAVLDAMGQEAAIETLTLVYEDMTRD